jgi:hypothetical protein
VVGHHALRPNPKEKHGVLWDPTPELSIIYNLTFYVIEQPYARVDCIPQSGSLDLASVLVLGVPTIRKCIVRPCFSLSEIMKHLLGQEEEEEEDEVGPAHIPRKANQTDRFCI